MDMENGKRTQKQLLQTHMKVNISMIKNVVKEPISGPREMYILGSLRMMKGMAKVR